MKKLLISTILLSSVALFAAELKFPAFRMTEPELLAVLKENGENDKVTACQELGHKGSAASVPAIAALLTDATSPALFHAARCALANIPGSEAALRGALANVKDAKRRAGLEATLRLKATPVPPDYAGASEILTAFPPKTAVQRGDLATVPGLVARALEGGPEAARVQRTLVGFPNAGIVDKMLALIAGNDAKQAKLAISVLGDRREHACLPKLSALARSTQSPAIRTEIFKAFATLCDGKDLPLLLAFLKDMPQEDRLAGAIIRVLSREFVTNANAIKIIKAEYGYYGPDPVPDAKGRPVVNVFGMVDSLVKSGARTILASNRLAGQGGFPRDPAPGKVKDLRVVYQVGNGPALSTVTRESTELELAGCALPAPLARAVVGAYTAANGAEKEALAKILMALEKHGTVPGADAVLFRPIFNGKDLTGWTQQDGYFTVKDGVILGASTRDHLCKPNHHLVYTAETLTDFELRAEFKLSRHANSGIQLRCRPQFIGDNGYQADMDGGGNYPGYIYHPRQHLVGERGADVDIAADGKKTVKRFADNKELQKLYKIEQWNDIRVKVEGRTITVWINGVKTTSVTDPREEFFPSKGHIALQLHQGPEMTVEFRNLRIR